MNVCIEFNFENLEVVKTKEKCYIVLVVAYCKFYFAKREELSVLRINVG